MKIEVSKHGALLAAVCALLAASIVLVSAYNNPVSPQSNPSYVGHSIDEIDWTQSVPQLKAVGGVSAQDNVTAPKICIGADCRTAWPVGGAVLPAGNTCPVGQYVKGLNTDGTVICGAPPCNPLTQTVACSGKTCGTVSDGCSNTYTCGSYGGGCPSGQTCNGNTCVTPGWTYIGTTSYQSATITCTTGVTTSTSGYAFNDDLNFRMLVRTVSNTKTLSASNLYVSEPTGTFGSPLSLQPVATRSCSAGPCTGYSTGAFCVTGGTVGAGPTLLRLDGNPIQPPTTCSWPTGSAKAAVLKINYYIVTNANVYKCK